MPGSKRIAAVIPCLNEEATIEMVVKGTLCHTSKVIVVDDGSEDRTSELAERAGANIVRHPGRLGKGAALQTGLAVAREAGFTLAIVLDGDGQHDPSDIPVFCQCAETTGASMVVGNRMHDPGSMPLIRRLVNWWMSRRLSSIAGQPFPDTQCGFRLIDLTAFSKVVLQARRFEIESELLLAFAKAGLGIAFVPVKVIYGGERSKIHPIKDTWRWFRWLWRTDRQAKGME